jgi:hypothetical protein
MYFNILGFLSQYLTLSDSLIRLILSTMLRRKSQESRLKFSTLNLSWSFSRRCCHCNSLFVIGNIYMRNSTKGSCSRDAIFQVVATIFHLGNVEFANGKEIDSSIPKDDKSRFHLKTAAELFMYVILHH